MPFRLRLFGPPCLVQREGAIALAFERRSQLLAHLALRRGAVPRTELAALLWPQTPTEQAHANLRKTLFRLRTLPWAPAIVAEDQALSFEGTTDVADFESAVAQARWADALGIAGAPPLAGFDDDASEPWSVWLRTERDRLRSAWRDAATQCLAAATDPAEVLELSSQLLADDPLDESALRAQMLAYVRQGHPARARGAYRLHAARLADELGVAPSPALQALHDSLRPVVAPATAALPAASDAEQPIVGRTAERRAVLARLQDGCRLLCLSGPGGVGKSRLARQLVTDLASRYPDGSVYVPLEDVESPGALGTRLARELALPLTGHADPLQAVIAGLRGRHMLLVLDNFEHLQPSAAAQLQALLDACPRVAMLVTSRVRLGLAGEQLLALGGLPCPEQEDADCLETFDAARLFVRAAQAVDPALQPAAEGAAIAEICRLVDGLPLALEIAAAWTRVLSCVVIAAELRRGIELLTQADTTRPARHASMAAVFEQSWQCLSPAERSAWARLTVFHGGFTLEAARVVAGATLPMLAALTDQSLLRKNGSRADLHPLLRQLAAGRLRDDEREASRAAHAVHYLHGLVPLLRKLQHGDKEVLQQVDMEFENVRAAWRWASLHGPAEALQPAVLPLMRFCDLRGRHPEGLALLREAAAGVGAEDARLGPLLDAAMANLEMRLDHFTDAQVLAERALLASRETRDHETRLMAFKVLGGCAHVQGRLQLSRRRYRQALAQAPAAIDPYNAAGILQNLGVLEKALGRYDASRALCMRSLVERRQLRDVHGEAMCLNNLAWLEVDTENRLDTAAMHLETALALSERHALTSMRVLVLESLTDLSVLRNDAAAVQRYGRRSFELAGEIGAGGVQSRLQLQFAHIAVQQRDLDGARNALRAAVEGAIALGHPQFQLGCVLCFAYLLLAQGEPDAAIGILRYAIDHPATEAGARNRARARLAECLSPQADAAPAPAPALDLWSLLHRIAAETQIMHAALIASLRAP